MVFAMKRMSSIGGVVSVFLMLSLSANDGYCFSKVRGGTSRSQVYPNSVNNSTSGKEIVGNAVQKALQSQPIQQLLQVGQDQLAQQTDKLTRNIAQKLGNSGNLQQNKDALDAEEEKKQAYKKWKRQQKLMEEREAAKEPADRLFNRRAPQQSVNSASLQEKENMLELQKAQTRAQYEQRIKMLRNQLNQEQARYKAEIKNIEQQIKFTKAAIRTAQKQERINKKANQILSNLKNQAKKKN